MVTVKGWWASYTTHNIFSYVMWDNYPFFFFSFDKQTHTHIQGRGKEVLTQRHTTTPLKGHGKIYCTSLGNHHNMCLFVFIYENYLSKENNS